MNLNTAVDSRKIKWNFANTKTDFVLWIDFKDFAKCFHRLLLDPYRIKVLFSVKYKKLCLLPHANYPNSLLKFNYVINFFMKTILLTVLCWSDLDMLHLQVYFLTQALFNKLKLKLQ